MPKLSAWKFIDEAILPVVLVIAAKLTAIFLLSIFYGFTWSFDSEIKNRLLFFSFEKFNEIVIVSNISDIAAIVVCCLGFAWSVFRGENFRLDLAHPSLVIKMHKKSQDKLLVSKEESFHQSTVWFVVSWFLLFTIFNNVIGGITSFFVLGIGISIVTTLSFIFYNNLRKS